MMIPFQNDGHLNPEQVNFNTLLSQCRVRVENSYALAKGKWRRLKFMHARRQDIVVDHISASFVLHNFIILHGEPMIDVSVMDINTSADVLSLMTMIMNTLPLLICRRKSYGGQSMIGRYWVMRMVRAMGTMMIMMTTTTKRNIPNCSLYMLQLWSEELKKDFITCRMCCLIEFSILSYQVIAYQLKLFLRMLDFSIR